MNRVIGAARLESMTKTCAAIALMSSALVVASCAAGNEPPTAGVIGYGGSASAATGEGGNGYSTSANSTTGGETCGAPSHVPHGCALGPSGDAPARCPATPCDGPSAPIELWSWTAPSPEPGVGVSGAVATPLVGNLTDDDANGTIDLCDVPDVLVTAISGEGGTDEVTYVGQMHLLSGDTGAEHFVFPGRVSATVTPALGDIDGDGLTDVVTMSSNGRLVAYEHDGTPKWTGDFAGPAATCSAVALYDLEGDGSIEILLGRSVFDASGHLLWGRPESDFENQLTVCSTATAADLDGDGELEVLMGRGAYRADGTVFWEVDGAPPSHPQVADFLGWGTPQVLFTNELGFTLIDRDGTVLIEPTPPANGLPGADPYCRGKPVVVDDMSGDALPEIGGSSCEQFAVYSVGAELVPLWLAPTHDPSGIASTTAFDLTGDGKADVVYGDEDALHIFDGPTGSDLAKVERLSRTYLEFPVVADVDDDGSADVVVPWSTYGANATHPTVVVYRDSQRRWPSARRIWNQHAYHVTNVREDGTIPTHPLPSWQGPNTFRANAPVREPAVGCNKVVP